MELNKAQKEAVEYLDGPLLVLAGPGTGKTQLLSARVAHILEATDTAPENILCITFTESGANNMRERLLSLIGKDANKVNIHTYHAFGADVLAQYQNYATEPTRLIDEPVDVVTQLKIIGEIQRQLPPFDILRGDRLRDINDTIKEAKAARLSAADLRRIAEVNLAESEQINAAVNPILAKLPEVRRFADGAEKVYRPLLLALSKFIAQKPIVGGIEKEANVLVRDLNQILETEEQQEKPSISPLTRWKDRNFERDAEGNWRLANLVANKKLQSLANVMEQYNAWLEERGWYDFADMIEEAIRVLKEDQGFRLTLAERYQYILLDEFQDTNPSQFELIKLITVGERPDVMAVGDDDQAIFEFQGANASGLIEFENYYQAHLVKLTENYRSTQEILDLAAQVAGQVTDSFARLRKIPKGLTAVLRRNPAKSQIERQEYLAADAEYYSVARQIHELVQRGERQSEIAVICPKHKYIQPLLPYLKAYPELKIAYEKRENILEDEKIHQLMVLAEFVYALASEQEPAHRLLEVLSFPFWGLDPLKVINKVERTKPKRTLEYLTTAEDKELATVADFLARLVATSFEAPLELFLDYLTGVVELPECKYKSPFLDFYAQDKGAYQTLELYENLATLRESVRAHGRVQTPKLKDLVEFLEDYRVADEAIMSTSPYQEAAEAVQILTAHKAKGLEFKHVFMIATDNLAWGGGKGNNNFLALPKNLAQIRHTGVTADEQLRLLFVAMTRAEEHLVMTNARSDFAGKSPKRLEYLEEVEQDGVVVSPFLPSGKVQVYSDELAPEERAESIRSQWVATYQELTPKLRPILEKRVENYHLTATALTKFIDRCYAGPRKFYEEDILRAPQEAYAETIQFGNLIHAAFEAVTNRGLSDQEAVEFFKAEASKAPIPATDLPRILEKGEKSIVASLKEFAEILRGPQAKAEVNLYHEHLALGTILLTGKIDHINIDEKNKTIEIYDFKTGKFRDGRWTGTPELYKYALQLGFYKLLLNLSPTYSKYKVERGHILFVTPNQPDLKVHDKVYEFNEQDEKQLKELMRAVYAQIKTLEFVQNPELMVEPERSSSMTDLKKFTQKIIETAPKQT